MNRVRAIIPREGEGLFYNIDDLLPLIPMEKEQWDKLFNEAKNNVQKIFVDYGSCSRGFLKFFDKFHFVEEIQGATGIQKHLYCHKEFFYFFCDRPTLKRIFELIEGRPIGGEKHL